MQWLMWVVLAASAIDAQVANAGTVYRCVGASGEVMFTDLACPGGRVQTAQTLVTIDMGNFSAAEGATLERLQREDAARSKQAAPARLNSVASPRSGAIAQRALRCAAARAGLDQVRAIKRHGYRASRAAALNARERKYQSQQHQNCAAIP